MFVIKTKIQKGTHLWLYSKIFNQKYSSSVWKIQVKEKLIWSSRHSNHSFYFWNIFSFSHFCFNFLYKPHKIKLFLIFIGSPCLSVKCIMWYNDGKYHSPASSLISFCILYSNMTSFFRFANTLRSIRWQNLISICDGTHLNQVIKSQNESIYTVVNVLNIYIHWK